MYGSRSIGSKSIRFIRNTQTKIVRYIEPTESQTKVVHEVWRGQLNTLKIAPDNPAWVIAEAIIPEQVGGWYVREVGLLDTDGTLVAIGKFPETYKPRLPADLLPGAGELPVTFYGWGQ